MVKKLFLLFIVITLNSLAMAAEFVASVDRDQIGLNETINLKLSLVDTSTQEAINLVKIKESFDIISTSNYSSVEVINGVSSVSNEWHFILKPKKIGSLLIPAITLNTGVGKLYTKEISITVKKAAVVAATKNNNIAVLSKVSKDNPYLDEPIIYQIQLLTAPDLRDVKFDDLVVEGVLIRHLGAHKIYDSKHNRRPVKVIELSYLITPTRSGKLVIPPQSIKGFSVVNEGRKNIRMESLFNSFFEDEVLIASTSRLEGFEVASKELVLNVQPAVSGFVPWLSAESLSLETSFDNNVFEVGKPIKMTINIKAKGLAKNQLPPVGVDVLKGEGYKIYADNVEIDDKIENSSIISSRKEVFTIVPQRTGKITLPKIEIKWWNVKNKKAELASISSNTVDVTDSGFQITSQKDKKTPIQEPLTPKAKEETSNPSIVGNTIGTVIDNVKIYYLIASVLIIILLVVIFRLIVWSRSVAKGKLVNASHGNLSTLSSNPSREMIRKTNIIDNVKLTDTASPAELYKYLQNYANFYWQISANSSLETLFSLIEKQNPQIKKSNYQHIIKQIQDALYAGYEVDMTELHKDCQKFLKLLQQGSGIKKLKKISKLPNLNPI